MDGWKEVVICSLPTGTQAGSSAGKSHAAKPSPRDLEEDDRRRKQAATDKLRAMEDSMAPRGPSKGKEAEVEGKPPRPDSAAGGRPGSKAIDIAESSSSRPNAWGNVPKPPTTAMFGSFDEHLLEELHRTPAPAPSAMQQQQHGHHSHLGPHGGQYQQQQQYQQQHQFQGMPPQQGQQYGQHHMYGQQQGAPQEDQGRSKPWRPGTWAFIKGVVWD